MSSFSKSFVFPHPQLNPSDDFFFSGEEKSLLSVDGGPKCTEIDKLSNVDLFDDEVRSLAHTGLA